MSNKTKQALAAAWASIDGKDINDPEYTDGYLSDSEEMIARLKSRGYVVVPVEPTEKMMSVGHKQFSSLFNEKRTKYTSGPVIYEAMIKAAGGKE